MLSSRTSSKSILSLAAMVMLTPILQIAGIYTSRVEYKGQNCTELTNELDSLSRRENALVVAQEQRIKSSKVQGFWYGVGTGDGIEASELGNIRGKIEAVKQMMQEKGCR